MLTGVLVCTGADEVSVVMLFAEGADAEMEPLERKRAIGDEVYVFLFSDFQAKVWICVSHVDLVVESDGCLDVALYDRDKVKVENLRSMSK